jgi:hypothetical protein
MVQLPLWCLLCRCSTLSFDAAGFATVAVTSYHRRCVDSLFERKALNHNQREHDVRKRVERSQTCLPDKLIGQTNPRTVTREMSSECLYSLVPHVLLTSSFIRLNHSYYPGLTFTIPKRCLYDSSSSATKPSNSTQTQTS